MRTINHHGFIVNINKNGRWFLKGKEMKQETRGGKREGSGRPKLAPTKTLSYRIPLKLAAKIDKEIRKIIKRSS